VGVEVPSNYDVVIEKTPDRRFQVAEELLEYGYGAVW
jgi:hypothetical protein